VPAAAPPIDSAATTVVVPAERILPFRTAAQVAAELPAATRWIAEGLAAAGSITELVGKAKAAGKTTLLHHLCAAVLDGRAFLGRPTTHTAVVYLTEERPATHREALRRAGLLHRPDLHLLYWHEVHTVPWPQLMAGVVPHCHAVGAGLLVVDTIAQWAGLRGDRENNSGDARAAVEPLQLAAATGLAVVSVRHERKGGGEVGASGRGSSAFEGAVDIVLALRRPEGRAGAGLRHLLALSRFDETPSELVIELKDGEYVALGTSDEVRAQAARRAVLDELRKSGTPPPPDYAPPRGARPSERRPFDRFTNRAKRALALSQDEAVRMGHSHIGTEHLVVGLARLAEVAVVDEPMKRILSELKLTASLLRDAVARLVPPKSGEPPPSEVTLTPRMKTILEMAAREADRRKADYVEPEMLLLAVADEGEGVGAQVLRELGATRERVREVIG
jgi:hypothetical protein